MSKNPNIIQDNINFLKENSKLTTKKLNTSILIKIINYLIISKNIEV